MWRRADVVKIERPAGDELRGWGAHFPGGESPAYMAVNRNKRGIALDLRDERGAAALRRLADAAHNPALIYCSISGFGQTGPYASRGGYDLVAQGMSGIMSVTGEPGGDLVKVGVPVCDLNAGLLAANGILAAYIGLQPDAVTKIVAIVLLPVAFGMLVRRLRPVLADALHKPVRVVSLVVLVAVIVGAIYVLVSLTATGVFVYLLSRVRVS